MRLRLESQGFNTHRYGNLLASTHTVFSRLQSKGEIKPAGLRAPDGKLAYVGTDRWAVAELGRMIGQLAANAFLKK